jgi:hypothetical protein
MQNDIATQVAVSPLAKPIPWAINAAGQILYWNGSKFVENAAGGCATSIGVGPNSRGLTNGTPWITGCSSGAGGNHGVYQMQTGGKWVLMQDDIATQVAVGPKGIPWAINAAGQILYWNGSKFVELNSMDHRMQYRLEWESRCIPDANRRQVGADAVRRRMGDRGLRSRKSVGALDAQVKGEGQEFSIGFGSSWPRRSGTPR